MISLSYAQVKVNQNGYISIQSTTTNPLSPITINGTGDADYNIATYSSKSGIYCKTTGTSANWGYAGIFTSKSVRNNFIVGLRGETIPPNWICRNSGRSFGVMGVGGYATPGWNFGVYGYVQGNNGGAGIYGTAYDDNGVYIDGKYAGYFNGNTKVIGNLTVSGTINGVILGSSSNTSSSSALAPSSDNVTLSEKLSGLNAIPYYKSMPTQKMPSSVKCDTTETVQELSSLEKQNLSKMHYALSAEKLKDVFPDLVYENEDGSEAINYVEMIPILLQYINELNSKITKLEGTLNTSDNGMTTDVDAENGNLIPSLSQNTPNPFGSKTSIDVNIPKTAKNAIVYIYDMNGKQLSQIAVKERGKVSVTISGDELCAGMYLYSLIIDNKLINTRRMIISK
jgi:hypothetical protein